MNRFSVVIGIHFEELLFFHIPWTDLKVWHLFHLGLGQLLSDLLRHIRALQISWVPISPLLKRALLLFLVCYLDLLQASQTLIALWLFCRHRLESILFELELQFGSATCWAWIGCISVHITTQFTLRLIQAIHMWIRICVWLLLLLIICSSSHLWLFLCWIIRFESDDVLWLQNRPAGERTLVVVVRCLLHLNGQDILLLFDWSRFIDKALVIECQSIRFYCILLPIIYCFTFIVLFKLVLNRIYVLFDMLVHHFLAILLVCHFIRILEVDLSQIGLFLLDVTQVLVLKMLMTL